MTDELAHAYELIKQQRFDEGRPILEQVVAHNPASSEARYALGYIHCQAGRWSDASAEFEEALALDPGNANAAYYLGEVAEKRGNAATATRYFTAALEINPEHVSATQKPKRNWGSPRRASTTGAEQPSPGSNQPSPALS